MSSHGIVDRSSLLFAGGLLLLRALDARHVGQASLGTFGFAVPSVSHAAWSFCDGWPKRMLELLLLRSLARDRVHYPCVWMDRGEGARGLSLDH